MLPPLRADCRTIHRGTAGAISAAGTAPRGGAGRQACLTPSLSLPSRLSEVSLTKAVWAEARPSSGQLPDAPCSSPAPGGGCGRGELRGRARRVVDGRRAESQSAFAARTRQGGACVRPAAEMGRCRAPAGRQRPSAGLGRAVLGRAAQPRVGSEIQPRQRQGEAEPVSTSLIVSCLTSCLLHHLFLSVGLPRAWQVMSLPGAAQPWHLHGRVNWEGWSGLQEG